MTLKHLIPAAAVLQGPCQAWEIYNKLINTKVRTRAFHGPHCVQIVRNVNLLTTQVISPKTYANVESM